MAEARAQRRLAAILAADVVGYSRLMGRDEAGTLATLKARRSEVLQPVVSKHHGRVVKVMGDGVLIEFASAVDAVECAVQLQSAMDAANVELTEDERIVLRIGINLGDVIVEGSDLYGDGVNIAARLESLADPGDVVISEKVRREVVSKLGLSFEDLGERILKNIAEAVRVYRVSGPTTSTGKAAVSGTVPSAKPSIAVLPFTNMSGDPAQDYFSDGLTENIITGLSRFRDLFVIARHSSFAYKAKAAKVANVCRELGVRFVLEGSIQMASGRVRVTAQLIDGTTDRHVWAERYDRKLEDIFNVQDEVTDAIVGALATSYGGRLRKAWSARSEGAVSPDFRAIDFFQAGQDALGRFTKEDNVRALELFRKAAELDRGYAKPHAKIAWSNIVDVIFGWSDDPAASLTAALAAANEAIRRDDDEAWGHWALGAYYLYGLQQQDRAVVELQKAVEVNPNDADVMTDLGLFLSYAGRPQEGLEWALRAMRLNPHYHDWYTMQLGQIYFDARRYEEGIATFGSLSAVETVLIELYSAACHAMLENKSAAQLAVKQALKFNPGATITLSSTPQRAPYKDPKDLQHFRAALRKAGLPE